jgi:DNA-binding MarR family transcriptional regulator
MKKDILIELINMLDDFEAQQNNQQSYTLQDFLGYMNTKTLSIEFTTRKIGGDKEQHLDQSRKETNSDTAILITFMYRYAKYYIKKALLESRIQTADEFAYLITLMTFDSLTKTELINKQVMEKTSGIEVIKRLVKNGLITEYSDPSDGRSIRVAITENGRQVILSVLPAMGQVSQIVLGNLTTTETSMLSFLLNKLDHFHYEIYSERRHESLDDLYNQLSK